MRKMYLLDNGHSSIFNQGKVDEILARTTYDPMTGKLFWNDHEKNLRPGKEVGCVHYPNKHRKGRHLSKDYAVRVTTLNGKFLKVHNAIFVHLHGYCPHTVDHYDGNGLNNMPHNLIDSVKNAVHENETPTSRNSTKKRVPDRPGLSRCVYLTKRGKYQVLLADPRLGRRSSAPGGFKLRYIGTFTTLDEAIAARDRALASLRDPLTTFIPPLETDEPFPAIHV